jgi:hypothetical protein
VRGRHRANSKGKMVDGHLDVVIVIKTRPRIVYVPSSTFHDVAARV